MPEKVPDALEWYALLLQGRSENAAPSVPPDAWQAGALESLLEVAGDRPAVANAARWPCEHEVKFLPRVAG